MLLFCISIVVFIACIVVFSWNKLNNKDALVNTGMVFAFFAACIILFSAISLLTKEDSVEQTKEDYYNTVELVKMYENNDSPVSYAFVEEIRDRVNRMNTNINSAKKHWNSPYIGMYYSKEIGDLTPITMPELSIKICN